jgi:hypothetical protein
MNAFILGTLAALIVAFVCMLTIQIIRIEKKIDDLSMLAEVKVKKKYES